MSDSPGRILVGGEALIDLVLAPSGQLRAHPGGGPYNVARTIARLGRPVSYLGRISGDRLGTQLRHGLRDDGVQLDAVVATADPTTLAIAEVGYDGSATYRFYTDGTSSAGLTPAHALAVLPERVDVVHVGTLGLVLEPMAAALEAVVAAVSDNALVVLDLNSRPSATVDVAAYRGRVERILVHTDLVKMSEEDLAWLEPDLSPADAAHTMLEHERPSLALVTKGANGALALTADGGLTVAAHPVKVIDTIGAGDAFGGGFVAWWHQHGLGRADLGDLPVVEEAVKFAAVVAAMTCARAGAEPPLLGELPAASPAPG